MPDNCMQPRIKTRQDETRQDKPSQDSLPEWCVAGLAPSACLRRTPGTVHLCKNKNKNNNNNNNDNNESFWYSALPAANYTALCAVGR